MASFVKPKVYTGVTAAMKVKVGDKFETVAYVTDFTLDLSSNSEDFNVIGQRYQNSIPTYNNWTANTSAKASFENKGQLALLQAYQNMDFVLIDFIINSAVGANGEVDYTSIVKATGFATIESLSIGAGEGVTSFDCSLKGAGNLGFSLPEYTAVTTVKVTPSELELNAGSSQQLEVKVLPENATNPTVTWTSSDPTKVKVDEMGFVIAVADTEEPVTITATSEDVSTVSGTCSVTVGATV